MSIRSISLPPQPTDHQTAETPDGNQGPSAVDGMAGNPDFMLSIARGLAVIRAFGAGRQRLSVADVARLTHLSRAAARRCLYTLAVLGYAKCTDGLYELTPEVTALGRAYLGSQTIARVAQPVLDRVSAELRESCSVAVLDGEEILYVARVAARRLIAGDVVVGSRLPAFCTSMGRVLVANSDPGSRDRFVSRTKVARRTAHTIVDKGALRVELARVASQGYAVVDQEFELGLRALAVPIVRAGVAVAALNVSVHVSSYDRNGLVRQLLPVLRAAAEEIGEALSPAI